MKKYIEYKINLNTDFISKAELFGIISKIGNPVINSIKNDIYKLFFFLPDDKEKRLLFNENFEIFIKEKVLCIVDFIKTNIIKLGFILYSDDYEKNLEMFKKVIEKYLQAKNISYHLEEIKNIPTLLSPIEKEVLTNYDTNLFKALSTERYELIKNINNVGAKIYKKDLYNVIGEKIELIEDLIKLNFLHKEFIFICKETGRQIIQLASLEVLESNPEALKCFYCGASLKNEIIEEIISLSNISNEIVKDNLWIVSIIYKSLVEEGIKEILIDAVEIGKIVILTHLSEPIIILILKEDFKIHHISLLDVYLSNYKSNYIVLITISTNAKIIKDYLSQKGSKVILIDSYENLEINIKNTVDKMTTFFIKDKLEEYNQYFSFRISDLIEQEYTSISTVETSVN